MSHEYKLVWQNNGVQFACVDVIRVTLVEQPTFDLKPFAGVKRDYRRKGWRKKYKYGTFELK